MIQLVTFLWWTSAVAFGYSFRPDNHDTWKNVSGDEGCLFRLAFFFLFPFLQEQETLTLFKEPDPIPNQSISRSEQRILLEQRLCHHHYRAAVPPHPSPVQYLLQVFSPGPQDSQVFEECATL
jgi:hypothetical protein